MTQILDGKAFSAEVRRKVAQHVEKLKKDHGITPGLAVILVGKDPASEVYVRNKGKQTREAGMTSFEYKMDESVSETKLLTKIQTLNNDPKVHGILCQLPLPKHINESLVINSIIPEKDVDGFHISNVGLLNTGQDALTPCTPLGCLMLLRKNLGNLSGKDAVIIGRSNIVGKPMASLLLRDSCTVTIAHSRTKDIKAICKKADILIAAAGQPEMVNSNWIGQGATVIDVGINRVKDESHSKKKFRLVGDVNFKSACEVAGSITPVPGGVGPMTIACLLANTVTACCRSNKLEVPPEFLA